MRWFLGLLVVLGVAVAAPWVEGVSRRRFDDDRGRRR